MLLTLHPTNPQPRLLKQIVECLQDGGIIIYPTDTIYGLGCSISKPKAIEKICVIKGLKPEKAQLSFICNSLSHLSDYAKPISTPTYRILKEHLPGPYTFILNASKQVPKILQSKKNTIGLRIPNNIIALQLITELNEPILSASLPNTTIEEYTDPEVIYETFGNQVDIVIDGGMGGIIPSTIIDYTNDEEPLLIREGLGKWE